MTDISIPPAALEAGARAIAESLRTARLTLESDDGYKPEARAACLAMINAWPGMLGANQVGGVTTPLILPFPPAEASDE